MGSEQVNDLSGRETNIRHARQDLVGRVGRVGNEAVRRRLGDVGSASQELKTRTSGTVSCADGASKLNATIMSVQSRGNARKVPYKSPKETPWARAKGMNCESVCKTLIDQGVNEYFTYPFSGEFQAKVWN